MIKRGLYRSDIFGRSVDNAFSSMEHFFSLLFLFPVGLSLLSSLLSFYFCLTLLVIFGRLFSNKYLRRYISVIAIINACIIFSSRVYLQSGSDDFSHYYQAYILLLHGGSLAQYAHGLEFFISIFFKLLIIIFGRLSIPEIFFSVSIFSVSCFYVWVELHGINAVDDDKKSLCVASCLAFFMYALSTQLMRQMLATPFLLFALSYGLTCTKGRLSLFLATGAHLSSFPLYFVLRIFLGENKKRQIVVITLFVLFGLLFSVLLNHLSFFSSLPVVGDIFSKLQYYNAIQSRGNEQVNGNTFVKYMIVMVAGMLVCGTKIHQDIRRLFFLSCISYIILIPVPLLSSRVFLVMTAVGLGYFMFFSFYRLSVIYRILLVMYFIVRVITLGPCYIEQYNGFDLWGSYSWYYLFPGKNLFLHALWLP